MLMTLRPGSTPARDEAEALVLLREPGTVAVRAGSQVARCTLPAGLGICAVSLPGGESDVTVSAYLERAGDVVLVASSPWPVRAHPPVQDLQYTATMGVAP
ncbi:hypothetical protein ACSVDM_16880 [Nocardia sp. JW2]|uniref:Uncharacterized protein n=1 Tax=Nocardia coubleae TaxID=356147 RepID=A0A846W2X5_9NOCA|nr:hypothetical protein [Nocardia coubleae]NKX87511.1 hypothetical protein [Nocardia coubleae]